MKAVYSDAHPLHRPGDVVENGVVRKSRDVPEGIAALLRAVQQSDHEVVPAVDYGMDPLLDVLTARYFDFLATAFSEWTRAGLKGRVFPANFDARPQIYKPDWSVVARAGYHLHDQLTPVDEGTRHAATGRSDRDDGRVLDQERRRDRRRFGRRPELELPLAGRIWR